MHGRVVGVDVGGTKVSVAALEGTAVSEQAVQPTRHDSADALIEQIVSLVRAQGDTDAVGVGVPSVVDFATGTIRASVNVPLHDIPLRELLSDHLGVPVFVDNDGALAALGEAYDDELRPIADSLVAITVGTGIGGGIVLGGHIYRGATGAAAELGHMIVAADLRHGAPPAPADFPDPHSIEHWASGGALTRLGEEMGIGNARTVAAAAQAGDKRALQCMRVVAERLGVAIANIVNLLDPQLVLIGGGVSAAGALLLDPAREAAQRFILPGVGTRTKIEIARHGPAAGVRGAALLALLEGDRARAAQANG